MLLPHAIAQIRDALPALRRGQADVVVTMLQTLLEHLEEVQAELDAERNGRGIDAAELNLLTTIEDVFRRWAGTPVIYHDMFKALDTLRQERRGRPGSSPIPCSPTMFAALIEAAVTVQNYAAAAGPRDDTQLTRSAKRLRRLGFEGERVPPESYQDPEDLEGVVHTESGRVTLDRPNWTEVPRGRRDIVIPGKNHPVADAP